MGNTGSPSQRGQFEKRGAAAGPAENGDLVRRQENLPARGGRAREDGVL